MNWRRIIICSGLCGLLTIGLAWGKTKPVHQDSMLTIPPTLHEYYYGGLDPERLAYAMDLWYDAVLKCDDNLAMERQAILFGLLQQDVDSTGRVLKLFNRLLVQAERDAATLDSGNSLRDDYPLLEELNRDIYSEAWDVYRTKQRLLTRIHRSEASSNKYRLMSDYIEVLRREIGLPKLRLASKPEDGPKGDSASPIDVRVTEGVTGKPKKN